MLFGACRRDQLQTVSCAGVALHVVRIRALGSHGTKFRTTPVVTSGPPQVDPRATQGPGGLEPRVVPDATPRALGDEHEQPARVLRGQLQQPLAVRGRDLRRLVPCAGAGSRIRRTASGMTPPQLSTRRCRWRLASASRERFLFLSWLLGRAHRRCSLVPLKCQTRALVHALNERLWDRRHMVWTHTVLPGHRVRTERSVGDRPRALDTVELSVSHV